MPLKSQNDERLNLKCLLNRCCFIEIALSRMVLSEMFFIVNYVVPEEDGFQNLNVNNIVGHVNFVGLAR